MEEDNWLTRKDFNAQSQEKHHLSSSAIPEPFIEEILVQMIEKSQRQAIVDMIEADGKITPVMMTRLDTPQQTEADTANGYLFELQFFGEADFSEKVYLDDQKEIYKIILRQRNVYVFERTSLDVILKQFPEMGDYVRQKTSNKQDVKFY
jgi:hypothetical protein